VTIGLGSRNRNAEIADPYESRVVDEDVGWLQVAVQHTLGVCGRQTGTQLEPDFDNLLRRHAADAAQQRREVLALDELHREEDDAVPFAHTEHAAHGRVGDLPGQPHLAEDPFARGGTRGLDDFQRDFGVEHQILCAPDITHAAGAEPFDHPVTAREYLSWAEHDLRIALWRGGRCRVIRRLVELEQRLDFLPKRGVAAAGFVQKSRTGAAGEIERGKKQLLGVLR
jgi:hypothetical protein